MTTEPGCDDRAARLQALHQRRAASMNDTPRKAAPERAAAPAPPPTSRPRRRHAATGARILAGSLSAGTALGLVGAMAGGVSANTGAPASEATQPPSSASTVISLRRSGATQDAGVAATQVVAAPRVTPAVAAPVTTSRGS